ncbi:unnamed protein product [Polarella glacialis]|uniref:Uncharacterized protein n=1 Tax=Polarella glacialis TaxID=89957 RepID=A0A813IRP9_POLGL|nr:unnamed protein product [Polarella glacialis]CAE8656584.1 unnamed protein product [Polarella glacialis]
MRPRLASVGRTISCSVVALGSTTTDDNNNSNNCNNNDNIDNNNNKTKTREQLASLLRVELGNWQPHLRLVAAVLSNLAKRELPNTAALVSQFMSGKTHPSRGVWLQRGSQCLQAWRPVAACSGPFERHVTAQGGTRNHQPPIVAGPSEQHD